MDELKTINEIADTLQEYPNRVRYMATKLRIRPVKRVGNTGLYDEAQMQLIKQGLYGMRIQRSTT